VGQAQLELGRLVEMVFAESIEAFIKVLKKSRSDFEEAFTRLGEANASGRSMKERRSQGLLKMLNLPGNRALRETEFVAGSRETACPRNGTEQLNRAEIKRRAEVIHAVIASVYGSIAFYAIMIRGDDTPYKESSSYGE
jgi:hypothetical protein